MPVAQKILLVSIALNNERDINVISLDGFTIINSKQNQDLKQKLSLDIKITFIIQQIAGINRVIRASKSSLSCHSE
ncbi:hypothetical protein EYC84_007616 [Monilinia fructicola]|uniref:Uncharacterized protein n=1 Tax=Monilinia fructicola TaxID=38448 RepID=A0A5M9JIX4_MONFR|nr:hypothetical protein EYC84_007616 [Monilinia fructicola]